MPDDCDGISYDDIKTFEQQVRQGNITLQTTTNTQTASTDPVPSTLNPEPVTANPPAANPTETNIQAEPSSAPVTTNDAAITPQRPINTPSLSENRDYRTQTLTIGQSAQGKPIKMTIYAPEGYDIAKHGIETIFIGGIHGDEPNAVAIGEQFIDYLNTHTDELDGEVVGIVSHANPDGITHGTRPESEPETRALRDMITQYKPEKIVAIHTGVRNARNYFVDYDGRQSIGLARAMILENDYPLKVFSPNFGSLGNNYGREEGIQMVTLEAKSPVMKNAREVFDENLPALLAAIHYE